jgi:hypothetical protein
MARRVSFPFGAWPIEMCVSTAAAYVDEPSIDAFLAKVKVGIYGPPAKRPGMQDKWHRHKLDQDVARRHGIRLDKLVIEDVMELI